MTALMTAISDRLRHTPTYEQMEREAEDARIAAHDAAAARKAAFLAEPTTARETLEAAQVAADARWTKAKAAFDLATNAAMAATAAIRGYDRQRDARLADFDRELRATGDPAIEQLAKVIEERVGYLRAGSVTPPRGAHAGEVAFQLQELYKHVRANVALLSTAEAEEAVAKVRAEVALTVVGAVPGRYDVAFFDVLEKLGGQR